MVLILAENGHAGMLLAIASLALVAVFGGLTILALLVADGRIGFSPCAL